MAKLTIMRLVVLVTGGMWALLGFAQESFHDADAVAMRATFKIESGGSLGTAFMVGVSNMPQNKVVLVTAAHVFEKMPYSNAIIHARSFLLDGSSKRFPFEFPIRDTNGAAIWTRHKTEDVAAIWITLPRETSSAIIMDEMLITEKYLSDFKIHPGDELRFLGYPLGIESSDIGFPVLRTGRISSYPLLPVASVKSFLMDMQVLPGNSGGPVYILERRHMHDGSLDSVTLNKVIGMVTDEVLVKQPYASLTDEGVKTFRINLGRVVHAEFIREVVNALPPMKP